MGGTDRLSPGDQSTPFHNEFLKQYQIQNQCSKIKKETKVRQKCRLNIKVVTHRSVTNREQTSRARNESPNHNKMLIFYTFSLICICVNMSLTDCANKVFGINGVAIGMFSLVFN